ncbi:MAG: dTMP kinase [Candidatus Promineofilum sp.]|nr:dTMP kinase [Promineifilum sp.]
MKDEIILHPSSLIPHPSSFTPMFITLEGPEGAGKTTQLRGLAEFLRGRGFHVVTTREPGGTAIGDQIRHVLHDTDNAAMSPTAEVLLYAASRAQLVAEVIRPALAAGHVVLCDRYADSTMAYQGYGRGLDRGNLAALTAIATGGLRPDLTLLLDLDVERGLARRRDMGEEMNRLDLETVEFHRRVREGYLALAAAEPARWLRIDADRPGDEVQSDLRRAVLARLETINAE